MTTALLPELRDALQRRLDVVADREFYARDPAGYLEALVTASEAVNRYAAELPRETDPMLRHFLEKQSYVKALDWLKAREIA